MAAAEVGSGGQLDDDAVVKEHLALRAENEALRKEAEECGLNLAHLLSADVPHEAPAQWLQVGLDALRREREALVSALRLGEELEASKRSNAELQEQLSQLSAEHSALLAERRSAPAPQALPQAPKRGTAESHDEVAKRAAAAGPAPVAAAPARGAHAARSSAAQAQTAPVAPTAAPPSSEKEMTMTPEAAQQRVEELEEVLRRRGTKEFRSMDAQQQKKLLEEILRAGLLPPPAQGGSQAGSTWPAAFDSYADTDDGRDELLRHVLAVLRKQYDATGRSRAPTMAGSGNSAPRGDVGEDDDDRPMREAVVRDILQDLSAIDKSRASPSRAAYR